jgi:hypothetical protein
VTLFDYGVRPLIPRAHHTSSEFPPVYFLDYELSQQTGVSIPNVIIHTRPELQALAEGIREQAKVYFHTIHPWLPFLSKKIFNERLLNPFTPRTSYITILLACINLICTNPEEGHVRTGAYYTIKSSLVEAEMAGALSFRILQAWVLLCVYEFGHAIYPSAFLSIGACVRYAVALGLNLNETTAQRNKLPWMDAEERSRTLWVILMLDR